MASDRAVCGACPHGCSLGEGQRGLCGARAGRMGEGDSLVVAPEAYGRTTGLALDPIEKKPFARFMPGTRVLSTGSYGCNMDCPWCQNWHISAAGPDDVEWRAIAPADLVAKAKALRPQGCAGLAFTYNEPLICWEFVRDASVLAHEAGLVSTIVTNGMCSEEVLTQVLPVVDAANVDLKCFDAAAYEQAGGSLEAVKRTIAAMAACPTCHLEVTWLVVPGVSDDQAQMDAAAAWLAGLDPNIPLHVTRFFPCHRMDDVAPTPLSTLFGLVEVAQRHLVQVIPGNV